MRNFIHFLQLFFFVIDFFFFSFHFAPLFICLWYHRIGLNWDAHICDEMRRVITFYSIISNAIFNFGSRTKPTMCLWPPHINNQHTKNEGKFFTIFFCCLLLLFCTIHNINWEVARMRNWANIKSNHHRAIEMRWIAASDHSTGNCVWFWLWSLVGWRLSTLPI